MPLLRHRGSSAALTEHFFTMSSPHIWSLNFWPLAFLSHWHPLVFCLPATVLVLLLLSGIPARKPHRRRKAPAWYRSHVRCWPCRWDRRLGRHKWQVLLHCTDNMRFGGSNIKRRTIQPAVVPDGFLFCSVSVLYHLKFWGIFFLNNLNIWFGLELSFIFISFIFPSFFNS